MLTSRSVFRASQQLGTFPIEYRLGRHDPQLVSYALTQAASALRRLDGVRNVFGPTQIADSLVLVCDLELADDEAEAFVHSLTNALDVHGLPPQRLAIASEPEDAWRRYSRSPALFLMAFPRPEAIGGSLRDLRDLAALLWAEAASTYDARLGADVSVGMATMRVPLEVALGAWTEHSGGATHVKVAAETQDGRGTIIGSTRTDLVATRYGCDGSVREEFDHLVGVLTSRPTGVAWGGVGCASQSDRVHLSTQPDTSRRGLIRVVADVHAYVPLEFQLLSDGHVQRSGHAAQASTPIGDGAWGLPTGIDVVTAWGSDVDDGHLPRDAFGDLFAPDDELLALYVDRYHSARP